MNNIIVCIIAITTSISIWADENWVRRAAFDIGSGSTKMVIADVNTKTSEMKIIHSQDEKVDYQESLENSDVFGEEVKKQAIIAMAKLKYIALQKGATAFNAVATASFRKAKNGKEFATFLTNVFGIPTTIITQRQEAIIGFYGGLVGEKESPQNVVVWDIGAGSMQITMVSGNKHIVYEGKLASVTFAQYLIKEVQKKESNSPNPISHKNMAKGMEYAQSIATQIPQEIKDKLAEDDTKVIGIGGVHYYSIRGQVKMDDVYGLSAIGESIIHSIGKTDEQIGSKYASTEISNLILASAFMYELGINIVEPKKVSMANGILIHHHMWK